MPRAHESDQLHLNVGCAVFHGEMAKFIQRDVNRIALLLRAEARHQPRGVAAGDGGEIRR